MKRYIINYNQDGGIFESLMSHNSSLIDLFKNFFSTSFLSTDVLNNLDNKNPYVQDNKIKQFITLINIDNNMKNFYFTKLDIINFDWLLDDKSEIDYITYDNKIIIKNKRIAFFKYIAKHKEYLYLLTHILNYLNKINKSSIYTDIHLQLINIINRDTDNNNPDKLNNLENEILNKYIQEIKSKDYYYD